MLWLITIPENLSTLCLLAYQSTVESRQHTQSPCLRHRAGLWPPAAVLQLSVQELPRSAPWRQPLLLHLPTGQLLPGARWLRQGLGKTTRTHRLPLRSGGRWVTVPKKTKRLPNWNILRLTLFFILHFLLDKLLIKSGGYTNCGLHHWHPKMKV